ncbi:hypothetical protein LTR16_011331, partial [Cryomyces antarcticus]
RLRRPWLLLRRDRYPSRRSQNSIPPAHHHPAWQPRVASNHASLRLLRRVPAQIRQRECLEVLHRSVRLPSSHRAHRQPDLL